MAYTFKYTTLTDIRNKAGLTTAEVADAIFDTLGNDAERELETLTGRKWSSANAVTEYQDGPVQSVIDYPTYPSNLAYNTTGGYSNNVILHRYPVQSITEFKFLNQDGTTNTTLANLSAAQVTAGTYFTNDYVLDPINAIIDLRSLTVPPRKKTVKVVYTYGYSAVPREINDLAACLAGIRAWIYFLGANYNRLNSYSIPEQSATKGDFYKRGMDMINYLTAESERIMQMPSVGIKQRSLFFVTYGTGYMVVE